MNTRAPSLVAAAVALAATLVPVPAGAQRLAPDSEAQILLKVLSYVRNLPGEPDAPLGVAIVYDEADADSRRQAGRIYSAFEALGSEFTVHGRVPRPALVAQGPDLGPALARAKAHVLYVAEGADTPLVAAFAAASHWTTLAGSREQVTAGVALGVYAKRGQAAIVVNVRAAKAAGVNLSASLLRVAERVDSD